MLNFYIPFAKYSSRKASHLVLELIRDLRDPHQDFPSSIQAALMKYPTTFQTDTKDNQRISENNAKYLSASLVYRLAESIESFQSATLAGHELTLLQTKACSAFKEATDRDVPFIDVANVSFPVLGPRTDLGESHLEKYNRVLNLLLSISHVTRPTRWSDKFLKVGQDPFRIQRIHQSSVPLWMVGGEMTLEPKALSTPKLRPLSVILLWSRANTKYSARLKEHIDGYVAFEELTLPEDRQDAQKDPRYFPSGSMWRDTVRRQLRLQELRLDIVTMRLEVLQKTRYTSIPFSSSVPVSLHPGLT